MKIKLTNGYTIKVKKLKHNQRIVSLLNKQGKPHLFYVGNFAGNKHYRTHLICHKRDLKDIVTMCKNITKIKRPSLWITRID